MKYLFGQITLACAVVCCSLYMKFRPTISVMIYPLLLLSIHLGTAHAETKSSNGNFLLIIENNGDKASGEVFNLAKPQSGTKFVLDTTYDITTIPYKNAPPEKITHQKMNFSYEPVGVSNDGSTLILNKNFDGGLGSKLEKYDLKSAKFIAIDFFGKGPDQPDELEFISPDSGFGLASKSTDKKGNMFARLYLMDWQKRKKYLISEVTVDNYFSGDHCNDCSLFFRGSRIIDGKAIRVVDEGTSQGLSKAIEISIHDVILGKGPLVGHWKLPPLR
jgi:hypothetical protein